ncbi:MAG: hypothetical protein WAK29_07735 [Terriglobales bacterium]
MAKSKPTISLLDIFILFLVRDGIGTLYRLKHEAGISIGAASPSLHRLEKKFITRYGTGSKAKDTVGVRGKRQYMLSLFAYEVFKSDWLRVLEENLPTDTESVARLVAIAESENRSEVAKKALTNAIGTRRKRARLAVTVAGRSKIATRYRSILQACETARFKAEAATLGKILKRVK